MASRHLQRLRKLENDLARGEASTSSSSEEDVDDSVHKPFNPFDLLTDDEEASPTASGEDADSESSTTTAVTRPLSEHRPSPAKKAKAKQEDKVKNKQAGKVTADRRTPQQDAHQQQQSRAADEIDRILADLDLKAAAPSTARGGPAAPSTSSATQQRPLLAADPRLLRADEELRKIFGSRVVDAEDRSPADAGAAGAPRRVRRLMARGLIQRAHLKRGIIITPKDHWPRFDGGVSMTNSGMQPDGKTLYTYVYSMNYQAVQDSYKELQATFDPNNIAALVAQHPYHLDSLLTMFDLYRSMGEFATADEMIERCLYALEMAWHPSFLSADSRFVPYDEGNAPLFTALFRYTQSLSRRGLHRTALEACKLLLSLGDDDPMGALFWLDYLALRSGSMSFLRRFADEYGSDQSMALLPNFAFSLALGSFLSDQGPSSSSSGGLGSASTSGVVDDMSADDLLVKAVLLYPLVVVRLMAKLQEQGVGKDGEWSSVLHHPLFANASDGGSASLAHLVDIYVERQHLLWKPAHVQSWLLSVCTRVSQGDIASAGASPDDWRCVREELWPPSDVNVYRHLRVYDFSDSVARVPVEDVHGVDAAGLQDGGQAAIEAELRAALAAGRVPGVNVTEDELQNGNAFLMLLRSLLPWVNAGQEPPGDGPEGQGQ